MNGPDHSTVNCLIRLGKGKNGVIYGLRAPGQNRAAAMMFLFDPNGAVTEDPDKMEGFRGYVKNLGNYSYANHQDAFDLENFTHEFYQYGWRVGHYLTYPTIFHLYCYRWNPNTLILLDGKVKKTSAPWQEEYPEFVEGFYPIIGKIFAGIHEGDFEEREGVGGFFDKNGEFLPTVPLIRDAKQMSV